jgi:hypothetical protein
MSFSHDKGYRGERPIELLIQERYGTGHRPRAGKVHDEGDIAGLPIVFSIKNHDRLALAEWVDRLSGMVASAQVETGVVWHKRKGRVDPQNWYVTTSGRLFLPLLDAYLKQQADSLEY